MSTDFYGEHVATAHSVETQTRHLSGGGSE